jgi:hypothetical protein
VTKVPGITSQKKEDNDELPKDGEIAGSHTTFAFEESPSFKPTFILPAEREV